MLSIALRAAELKNIAVSEAIFQTLYHSIGYSTVLRDKLKVEVLYTIGEVINATQESCFEVFKVFTYYSKDRDECVSALLKRNFVGKLMKCLSTEDSVVQEHILTCVYDLAVNVDFLMELRELAWNDTFRHLVELYGKYREAVAYIMLMLSKVRRGIRVG
eukprot:TRINITY_DN10300_c0_g1_i1.p1 TRINITY_DN10300_c0_g1~~TRINITY_DN10300_c0_g1_i1.p1  ORF type:complete len:160 (+),score=20.14 TRINITY_DN10300_c0_g1_i1:172-651(+)